MTSSEIDLIRKLARLMKEEGISSITKGDLCIEIADDAQAPETLFESMPLGEGTATTFNSIYEDPDLYPDGQVPRLGKDED